MSLAIDYDHLWGNNKIIDYRVWPTWDLMRNLFTAGGTFLEIGAGNRPRIPIRNSHFVDTSLRAVENLNKLGAKAQVAAADSLPFSDKTFDVVCAFEIIEHVEDDKKAFAEIFRILKNGGKFLFSVPLNVKYWSSWDELAGHYRRYEPAELQEILDSTGFIISSYHAGRNITVFQRYLWLGKIGSVLYRRFPRPFIFLEYYLVTSIVRLETKLGASKGLKWQVGNFAETGRDKTSAFLMCSRKRYEL